MSKKLIKAKNQELMIVIRKMIRKRVKIISNTCIEKKMIIMMMLKTKNKYAVINK